MRKEANAYRYKINKTFKKIFPWSGEFSKCTYSVQEKQFPFPLRCFRFPEFTRNFKQCVSLKFSENSLNLKDSHWFKLSVLSKFGKIFLVDSEQHSKTASPCMEHHRQYALLQWARIAYLRFPRLMAVSGFRVEGMPSLHGSRHNLTLRDFPIAFFLGREWHLRMAAFIEKKRVCGCHYRPCLSCVLTLDLVTWLGWRHCLFVRRGC